MSKYVKRPMYEEYEDTPYITRNRELNTTSYNNLNTALNDINNFSYTDYDSYAPLTDAYSNYAWQQLNRNYQNAVNKNVQNQQQRLGTTGSSSGLYTTDTNQQYYNNLASNIASQTAQYANQLMGQELNRRYQNADLYNSLFNQTGSTTEAVDQANWNIRNLNKERQWLNDVDKNNNTGWNWFANVNKGALEGFSEGMKSGNIWGGIAGSIAGGIGNSGTNQTASSNSGSSSGSSSGSVDWSSLGNLLSGAKSKATNFWNNRQTEKKWGNKVDTNSWSTFS